MQRFTQDQIQTYNDAFQMFDREDRGFFASTELREILKIIGGSQTWANFAFWKFTVRTQRLINPFHANVLFIYPLKNVRKPLKTSETTGFLTFSGM